MQGHSLEDYYLARELGKRPVEVRVNRLFKGNCHSAQRTSASYFSHVRYTFSFYNNNQMLSIEILSRLSGRNKEHQPDLLQSKRKLIGFRYGNYPSDYSFLINVDSTEGV